MSKLPLTPTVILDKNGKRTTVHRKNGSGSKESTSTLPAPTANVITERVALKAYIAYELADIYIQSPKMRHQSFLAVLESMSVSDLRSLHETTQKMVLLDEGSHFIQAADTLRRSIQNKELRNIQIIKEHGEDISGHLVMHDVVTLVRVLDSMDTDTESFTANAKAHIYAAGRYLSVHGTPSTYYVNKNFLRFINRHPNHVDEAYTYSNERSLKEFDDEQFKEWLAAGALRDGSL